MSCHTSNPHIRNAVPLQQSICNIVVAGNIEKHAFIVSPGRQKIHKGIETKERAFWQQLIQNGNNKRKILELIHYVKVTRADRYSNNGQIICSSKSPVQLPFQN